MARNKKTTEDYLKELDLLKSDIFFVGEYEGAKTPVEHMCKNNHIWKTTPSRVLEGKGCPYCANNHKPSQEEYQKVLSTLPKRYKVLQEYINSTTPILHECGCGYKWQVKPNHILQGHGCPRCASSGFKCDKPAILYYVKVFCSDSSRYYYKVGITNNTLKERFQADFNKITPIRITKFSLGTDAKIKEKEILKKFHDYRITVKNLLRSGNTELFTEDVLQLDKEAEGG